MPLRRKTILLMLGTLAVLLVLLYVALRIITLDSFNTLERQSVTSNLERATNSFQDSSDSMERTMRDWSSWDETYQFAQDGNASFVAANLADSTFWTLDINMMMFVNAAGDIVYSKALDIDGDWTGNFLTSMQSYVRTEPRFFQLMTSTPRSGLVVVNGTPVLVASRPILHSDDSGPNVGTLVWGRILGTNEMAETVKTLRLSLDLRGANSASLPDDFRAALNTLSPIASQNVIPQDENTVSGYGLINDIYGKSMLLVKTSQSRDVYWQGQVNLNYFTIALAAAGVVFALVVLLLLDRLILAPLAHLSQRVRQIGVNNNFTMRLPVSGSNELAQLGTAVNTMLDELAQSRDILYESNTKLEIRVNERTIELERQRAQLQAIMDTMGEGLVYCVDGAITYVNRALVELLNYQVADVVGKPFSLLCPQLDLASTPMLQKPLRGFHTTFARSDGSTISVAITSSLVNEADLRDTRSVIIVRDITQELANKAQKDYFFARASHDLRNPLTSIMTRLYLLGKRPEQLETHLAALNYVSNHMLELVNDLLDVSRLETGEIILKRSDLVLQSVVEQVVDLQQADAELKHIRLRGEMAEQPLRVYGDPMRLNQAITNLVSNAIHYTDDGGEVVVRVTEETNSPSCVVVRVTDTGIGISPENLAHIFDAFFRVSDERGVGSGLGLYIVKEIVDLHGGELSVASELGKGTTFTIKLHPASNP